MFNVSSYQIPRNCNTMGPAHPILLEHILRRMSVGVAVLDCTDLRFLYANSFLLTLLDRSWRSQGVIGHTLDEVVSQGIRQVAQPVLRQVCSTGQGQTFAELPYEGFLETRGRTYWRVSIELTTNLPYQEQAGAETLRAEEPALLVTIEDVTEKVRSRLHLDAIHSISSTIVGRFALPQVLDSILEAVQELVGSTRCAILLLDYPDTGSELRSAGIEE